MAHINKSSLPFWEVVRKRFMHAEQGNGTLVQGNTETRTMPPLQPHKPARLHSIDALRGFDMLLIAGGGTFLVLLKGKTSWLWVDWLASQMEHPAWNGFTFYDFIFPLFLFIAGVSLPFSLHKGLSMGMRKAELYRKAFRRMLVLILLGIVYKNAPLPIFEPAEIRYVSVLGRIGFAGFVTTLLYLNFSWKGRLLWVAAILLLYYAVLFLVPVPGYGAGDLSMEGNLVGWIDRTFLPGRLLQQIYDELGLLTQWPALCLTVLGAWAGDILRNSWRAQEKVQWMLVAGIAGIGAGLVWGLHFPINKHLWSSSFILLTAGMSFMMLALFYWVIDVLQYKKWAFFFVVIGLNSLTTYLAYRFIDFYGSSRLLFSGLYAPLPEPWHEVVNALGALALVWLFLYVLYRNKIFLKV